MVLTIEEQAVIVAFRRHTLLPLDDCLYALQATIPHLTRSSLHRCLQRHGISRLPEVTGDKTPKRKFKAYPFGYFYIDIAEVQTAEVSNYDRWFTGGLSLLGAGGGYAAGGADGAALGAVGAGAAKAGALDLSARLPTDPQFVAWLGRAPGDATPAQITAHVRQLSNLAIRQPAIRGEIQQVQRLLSETGARPALASDGAPGNDQEADRRQAVAAGRYPPLGGEQAEDQKPERHAAPYSVESARAQAIGSDRQAGDVPERVAGCSRLVHPVSACVEPRHYRETDITPQASI